jgi:hypothetical protein
MLRFRGLWGQPIHDPDKAPAILQANGFKEVCPGRYTLGKHWVQIVDGKVLFGREAERFDTLPTPDSLAVVAPTADHQWRALHKVVALTANTPNLAEQLAAAGFREPVPGFFLARDNSWVMLRQGELWWGVDNVRLSACPEPLAEGSYPVFESLPHPDDWQAWRMRFAVAKVPFTLGRFTEEQLVKILRHLGFRDVGSARWVHPDGSEVRVSYGDIVGSRFQQWDFANFPYQNGTDSRPWTEEAKRWLAWVRSDGKTKPPY